MNFLELNKIEGLQFMPVALDKQPIHKGWQTTKKKYDFDNAKAAGLVCGALSGNVEVLDCDLKYDLSGTLYTELRLAVKEACPGLLEKMVVASTGNNGFHWMYRCGKIEGNKKLAMRPTSDDEKKETYNNAFRRKLAEEDSDDEKARAFAFKQMTNDKVRVLLETRGEGGYVMCYPTPGYNLMYGTYEKMQEITEEEREILFECCRSFNQVFEERRSEQSVIMSNGVKGLSPFDDYDNRGDVIALLENHGWRFVKKHGSKTIMLRPGDTKTKSSGNFDHEKNWFTVFSSSTEFAVGAAYKKSAVFAILECGGNYGDAAKKLYEMQYGDRREKLRDMNRKTPSRVNPSDNDVSFISKSEEDKQYMSDARKGIVKMGYSTGLITLDKHFLFKPGNLVMTNGHDNTGKSLVTWFFALMSAMLYGWKWLIFASENTSGCFRKRMIEFYWGKPINMQTDLEYRIASEFFEKHFFIIRTEDAFYNYMDILNMAIKCLKNQNYVFQNLLIDPYNSLKIELAHASKLSTHEYHYEALTEMKIFSKKNNVGMYVNNHAVTEALRKKDEQGYLVAPEKADTEGGGKFSNKADDFITIHRKTQHPSEWNVTELHIRKIKETETGGMPTPKNEPVKIIMAANRCAFLETVNGVLRDPVAEIHAFRKKNPTLPFTPPPPATEDREPWDDPN